MKVFLTGGSGLIGGALLARLAGDREVVALARSASAAAGLRARGADVVVRDLAELLERR